jgi:hypothetical protein
MPIIEKLLDEHRELRGMLLELLRDKKAGEKRKAFEALRREITAHHRAEEHSIFKAAMKLDDLKQDSLESIEEHHLLDLLMNGIKELKATDERFEAKVKVLAEVFQDHLVEEEIEQFPKFADGLGKDVQARLAEEYEEWEEKIKKQFE